MNLKGKVAIVTGGGVRIGKALALALAEQGARVAVHHFGDSIAPADETVAEIRHLGGDALAIFADLREFDQLAGTIQRAVAHFGQVDILVNSAAIFRPGDVLTTVEADWDEHFALNLKAPFFLCQAFAAHVGTARRAHVVNIADWRGTRPGRDYFAYTLTKAGVISMTRGLALALSPNIQVNAIAPGAILPPPGKDQVYLDRLAQEIPLRRAGSPAEVTRALLYLLDSDFVTGELIFVTGGQHL